jgi:hypothetical protein
MELEQYMFVSNGGFDISGVEPLVTVFAAFAKCINKREFS